MRADGYAVCVCDVAEPVPEPVRRASVCGNGAESHRKHVRAVRLRWDFQELVLEQIKN